MEVMDENNNATPVNTTPQENKKLIAGILAIVLGGL